MLFRRFLRYKKPRTTRIIVYGSHTDDWSEALKPSADVWTKINLHNEFIIEHIPHGEILNACSVAWNTIVIPLMEAHIKSCLDLRTKSFKMLIPSLEALEIFRNKKTFASYVKTNALSALCPKQYEDTDEIKFPCVLKRANLNAGGGIEVAQSSEHLAELLIHDMWKGHDYIIQELIKDPKEYVAHCVCQNGEIIWHAVYEYTLEKEDVIRRGLYASKRTSITSNQLRQIGVFLRPLKYSGPCNIDFKISKDSDVIVLEINPRLGGSLMRPENVEDLQKALESIVRTCSTSAPQALC